MRWQLGRICRRSTGLESRRGEQDQSILRAANGGRWLDDCAAFLRLDERAQHCVYP
jgi:hypothetical protein